METKQTPANPKFGPVGSLRCTCTHEELAHSLDGDCFVQGCDCMSFSAAPFTGEACEGIGRTCKNNGQFDGLCFFCHTGRK